MIVPLADRLPVSTANFSFDFKLKRFLRAAASREDVRHAVWLGSFTPGEQAALLTAAPRRSVRRAARACWRQRGGDRLGKLIYLYAKTYLQDDILVKVDRASMACSLEVRAPFLDVELVRVPVAASLRRLKLRRLDTKHLLKRAMGDVLPSGIANRPKKGFGIPVAAWFKGELREALQDELSPERIRRQGLFEPAEVVGSCPSTFRAGATTASRCGRSSSSSCGTAAGSRAVRHRTPRAAGRDRVAILARR